MSSTYGRTSTIATRRVRRRGGLPPVPQPLRRAATAPARVQPELRGHALRGKVNKYIEQNLLAKTLHPQCYVNNPSFISYKQWSALPFRAHPEAFRRKDLDERQELYRRICEEIWNPVRLDRETG